MLALRALLLGFLAVQLRSIQADHIELHSVLTGDRWVLESPKSLVPISCTRGDCSDVVPLSKPPPPGTPSHKIKKRAVVHLESIKDYIKFIVRGNKTRDDDRNVDPYRVSNITLGPFLSRFFFRSFFGH